MASLIYTSAIRNMAIGSIDFDTHSFKALLVTDAYTPNKDTHTVRSDVTNEVTGTGYTAGGTAVTPTVAAVDTANDRVDITFASISWANSTITARACVIYRDVGTAGTDLLVAYVDFLANVSSTNGTFAVTFSSPLRFQN